MRNEAASSGLLRGQSYLSDLFPRGIIPPRNKVREKLSAVISAARVDGDRPIITPMRIKLGACRRLGRKSLILILAIL